MPVQDDERTQLLPDQTNVFVLVHQVRKLIKENIDTTLSWDQLNAPDVQYTITRPLVHRFSKHLSPAIVYALLLNRLHFLRLAESDLSYSSLQYSRAEFCELLSTKLIRLFAADDVELVQTLVREWDGFQGAPAELIKGRKQDDMDDEMKSILEIAILSLSKRFLSAPLLQRAISLIHSGQILFTSPSSPSRALLPDTYPSSSVKGRGGRLVWRYDARREGGWLGLERLRIPKWREVIEIINFALIIGTFVLCLQNREIDRMSWSEVTFILVASGFALDEFAATKEHGLSFYSQSLFNGFDLSFLLIFVVYLGLRIHGLWTGDTGMSDWSFDVLACGAAILFPRLAFTVLKGNVVIIALKQMLLDFVVFMSLALVCFSGIFFALTFLGAETWSKKSIAWLMAQIWFGSSYLSFQSSASFHPVFGPMLLISYAALSNTLLVTILISILSNRYALVSAAAREEQFFQQAVNTVGGVKSDAIFSFVIPLNVVAFVVLGPAQLVLSKRAIHQATKFMVCITTWPLLLAIMGWERWTSSGSDPTSIHARAESLVDNVFGALGGGGDFIDLIFADGPDPALLTSTATTSRARSPLPSSRPSELVLERSEELEAELHSSSRSRTPSPTPKPKNDARGKGKGVRAGEKSVSSPLARVFGRSTAEPAQSFEGALGGLEVGELKAELKELKDRQERIESMLVTLTKGLRSDSL